MTISDSNKKFLDDLIQYYINESESYKQFANEYKEFSFSSIIRRHFLSPDHKYIHDEIKMAS